MRFSVQRFGTWEWLDYEAPLEFTDGPEWCLSAYGIAPAKVASANAVRFAPDGREMFEEWGTLVHLEIDESSLVRREWTAIVKESSFTNGGWSMSLVEFPGYFAGLPYEGLARAAGSDPAQLIRQLVLDSQAYRNAWFGCSVLGSTPVKLGTDLDEVVAGARAAMDVRKATLDALTRTKSQATSSMQTLDETLSDEIATAKNLLSEAQSTLSSLIVANAPMGEIATARDTIAARQLAYNEALEQYEYELLATRAARLTAKSTEASARAAYDAAKKTYDDAKSRRNAEGGAFEVRGEDLEDTYRAISNAAKASGIEWTTETVYSEGAPDVRIRIHYPQAGRRRDDLIFDTAVNISEALELERGAEYANAAIGIGAGEGKAAVRRTMSTPSLRMRRPLTVNDKSARTAKQLDAPMRHELMLAQAPPYPAKISVVDHPNCRIGAWSVGDIIRVVDQKHSGGPYDALLRITSWQRSSRTEAALHLQPVFTN